MKLETNGLKALYFQGVETPVLSSRVLPDVLNVAPPLPRAAASERLRRRFVDVRHVRGASCPASSFCYYRHLHLARSLDDERACAPAPRPPRSRRALLAIWRPAASSRHAWDDSRQLESDSAAQDERTCATEWRYELIVILSHEVPVKLQCHCHDVDIPRIIMQLVILPFNYLVYGPRTFDLIASFPSFCPVTLCRDWA